MRSGIVDSDNVAVAVFSDGVRSLIMRMRITTGRTSGHMRCALTFALAVRTSRKSHQKKQNTYTGNESNTVNVEKECGAISPRLGFLESFSVAIQKCDMQSGEEQRRAKNRNG
jgi:hypothetical protein